jgi:hypothetical protein
MKVAGKQDLIVLVSDRNMEATIRGILDRYQSLEIRPVRPDIRRHPEKDSGCRMSGVEYLSAFLNQYEHALLMFDREGCGQENMPVEDHENELNHALSESGWGRRGGVIVLDPELEIWVWSDSPHVATVLGWGDPYPDLKNWLQHKGLWSPGLTKPDRPKEAMEATLRHAHKPRSSSLYQELAKKVGLAKCTDRAFIKLKNILQLWFA